MQSASRLSASERRLSKEILRVHDQRVAFPAGAGVSHPLTDRSVRTAVERDDPRIVNHLVVDHDVIGGLE
jgi:hypothetical protein